ncbi:MAG: hypothetical protein QXY76_06850 [Nitrososphaeria archaeon]
MSEDKFGEIILFLDEILIYLRAIAAETFKEKAKIVIDSYERALVYSLLNGSRSQNKIEDEVGVPRRTISDWIASFVENGLVAPPTPYRKFHKALFTLKELDIDVSKLKKKRVSKQEKVQSSVEEASKGV